MIGQAATTCDALVIGSGAGGLGAAGAIIALGHSSLTPALTMTSFQGLISSLTRRARFRGPAGPRLRAVFRWAWRCPTSTTCRNAGNPPRRRLALAAASGGVP